MKKIIYTPNAPPPIGPYSQAVQVGSLLYTSGQIPVNPSTGKIEEASVEGQTKQVLENLEQVLLAGGSNFSLVIKTTVFLQDMNDFPAVNALYKEAFGEEAAPVRSTIEVASLPLGARIEIDAIAEIKNTDR